MPQSTLLLLGSHAARFSPLGRPEGEQPWAGRRASGALPYGLLPLLLLLLPPPLLRRRARLQP